MPKLSFFEAEIVERQTPDRPWRLIAGAMALGAAVLTGGYEIYWRGKELRPGDFNNTEALWAQERRKATGEATVLIGSSRIFFDTDLDVWEAEAGVRPVQLALEGTSPRIFLKDLAEDETFRGQVFVGVTAPLFFSTDGGRRASVLKYTRDETLAQRADHAMTMQLERVFGFIDEQTRPKRQVAIWPFPLREGMRTRFDPRKLEALGADRDARLWSRVVNDERYREEAKSQWIGGLERNRPPPGPDGKPAAMPDTAIAATIAEVKANVDKIRARGGDVAFLRFPYGGAYTQAEDMGFPRARFWDRLIAETDSVGVSWHDHPELQGYDLPEWSHLSASEATRYTRALVPIVYREIEQRRTDRAIAS